jgi:aminoglycoside phosphotransferase (APT) family kinase protein
VSEQCLLVAAKLVSELHEAGASSPLAAGHETVCHGDLGPHNTVFRDGLPVAFIDWDEELAGGRRAVDFAHAVWCFADLTEPDVALTQQARNTRLMCSAFPGMTPQLVIDELTARFRRARAEHEAAGRAGGVAVFERMMAWMQRYGDRIVNDPATS